VTQTVRSRAGVRRPGAVYGINLLDPVTRMVRMDYVGQTRQKGRAREMQHRDSQPWEDLIVGSLLVLAEGMWTDAELDRQEQAAIRRVRPRMNYEHNLHNPQRIEIWRQREQRWARDDAAGRPRWVPLENRQAGGLLGQPVGVPDRPPRRQLRAERGGFLAGYWLRMIRFLRSD
jgi:hypothetical protein